MKCIIVGAGTSGLIAARELAHYGVEAEVYERKKAIKIYTALESYHLMDLESCIYFIKMLC
jgi:FAD binding domain.